MIDFSTRHRAVVILKKDFNKFQSWALAEGVSFQEVQTDSDAQTLYGWLPSEAEEEYQSSWEDSGC
jgi:hypothetical protein